jgi:hypothetical protein
MGGILSAVLGGVGGFFKGGVLGVIGSLVTGWLDNRNKKTQVEKDIAAINASKELEIAKAKGNVLIETLKLQQAATSASYEHDTKTLNIGKDITAFFSVNNAESRSWLGYVLYLLAFGLDFIRGSLRPVMCYLLFFTAAGITIFSIRKFGIDSDVMKECAKYGVYTCMDSAGLVIGWYFGDRQQEKIKRK